MIGNYIGEKGVKILSETLKTNTTLKSLDLSCVKKKKKRNEKKEKMKEKQG